MPASESSDPTPGGGRHQVAQRPAAPGTPPAQRTGGVPYRPSMGAAARRSRAYGWLAGYVGIAFVLTVAALALLVYWASSVFGAQRGALWAVAIVLLIVVPAHLLALVVGWAVLALYRRYFAAGWAPALQALVAAATIYAIFGAVVAIIFG